MIPQAARMIGESPTPEGNFLVALSELTESDVALARLGDEVADGRMPRRLWAVSFRRELLQLYRWAAERLLLAARPTPRARAAPDSVVCLLPGEALAAHLLRRAVPFAALGIPTLCGFAPSRREVGLRVTRAVACALGLTGLLEAPASACQDLVRAAGERSLIVVTGRRETVRRVSAVARCQVIGCAGRCAVVVGVDPSAVGALRNALRAVTPAKSCSRVYAAYVCDQLREGAAVRSPRAGTSWASYPLVEVLARLHPSVIFTPEVGAGSLSRTPESLAGYRLIECAPDGAAASGVGFGADPVYGWTGDFTV